VQNSLEKKAAGFASWWIQGVIPRINFNPVLKFNPTAIASRLG
jgi:hypothetical protein